MKQKRNNMDYLIEDYYREKTYRKPGAANPEDRDRNKDKLYSSLDKMDILKDMDYDIDVDIMKAILEADSIKGKQRSFHESLLFSAVSGIILFIMSIITIKLNLYIEILYIQIVIFFIMPVLIIPFAKFAGTKEE